MTKKKNRFLTFIFSCLPGAAHMYMGFLKEGASLMTIFFVLIAAASWLSIGALMLCLPIIWFYAFFDANNRASLSDDEFYAMNDHYIFCANDLTDLQYVLTGRGKLVFAVVLILIGLNMLWKNFFYLLNWMMPSFIMNAIDTLVYRLPQIAIAFIIIAAGVYLIRGKKKELERSEKEYEDFPYLPKDYTPNQEKEEEQ